MNNEKIDLFRTLLDLLKEHDVKFALLWSEKETAQLLGISVDYLIIMRNNQTGPKAIKINGAGWWRYRLSDVLDWLDEQSANSLNSM